MRHPNILLVDRAVYLCCVKLCVAQKATDLFNRHTSVERIGCHSPAEPVRMDIFNTGPASEFAEHTFNAVFTEAPVWLMERHKQGWIVIGAAVEVHFKVNSSGWRYISLTLFCPLAEDSDVVTGKVDVRPVQGCELGYPDACGV